MNLNEFFSRVEQRSISVRVSQDLRPRPIGLDNEALFQLPFIALAVLVLAKDRRKPFVSEVGQLVGESLEATVPSFKGSSKHLGWSANLRVRTVKALQFLEVAGLALVDNRKSRVAGTDLGAKVVGAALSNDDDLAFILKKLALAYRNICVSRQLDMEVI